MLDDGGAAGGLFPAAVKLFEWELFLAVLLNFDPPLLLHSSRKTFTFY